MIKSILSFFSGNNDLAKGIVNTVDEAFYTNQEAQADTRGFIFSWLSATGPAASTSFKYYIGSVGKQTL